MSIVTLYLLESGKSVFRCVNGNTVTALQNTWLGCVISTTTSGFLKITDSSGMLNNWVDEKTLSRLYITATAYDTDTETVTESQKYYYSTNETDNSGKWVMFRQLGVPVEHLVDSNKLTADGIVDLYEIKLSNGTYLHLKPNNTVTWNGYDWQGIPLLFEGYSSSTSDTFARPTLSVANPDGAWSTFVRDGYLTRAVCTRYLVLYSDILNNNVIYQKRQWIIWYPKQLNKQYIQLELRNPMDGVNFDVPARMYMPPEFPFVDY